MAPFCLIPERPLSIRLSPPLLSLVLPHTYTHSILIVNQKGHSIRLAVYRRDERAMVIRTIIRSEDREKLSTWKGRRETPDEGNSSQEPRPPLQPTTQPPPSQSASQGSSPRLKVDLFSLFHFSSCYSKQTMLFFCRLCFFFFVWLPPALKLAVQWKMGCLFIYLF